MKNKMLTYEEEWCINNKPACKGCGGEPATIKIGLNCFLDLQRAITEINEDEKAEKLTKFLDKKLEEI